MQIHIGIETRIFPTLQRLIYTPPALQGCCVFLCDMPCCLHQRIHTVQRNQTGSWSRKHHFKSSLSSQSTKLMLAGLEDTLLSLFPISLHYLHPCELTNLHNPYVILYLPMSVINSIQGLYFHTGYKCNWIDVKCPQNLPDLASLLYGPHLPLHVSTAKVQVCPSAASFWLWKILRKPG